METELKQAIDALKNDIKSLEKEQKTTKPQRKTVHFKGERTITASDAAWKTLEQKENLRHMYAAYNLLRGKGFEITENNGKPLDSEEYWVKTGRHLNPELVGKHPLFALIAYIDDVLKKYGYKLPSQEVIKENPYWGKTKKKVYDYEHYKEIVCIGQ